jgi:hypothetical protein
VSSVAAGICAAALLAAIGLFLWLEASRARAWTSLAHKAGLTYAAQETGLGPFGSFNACRVGEGHLRRHGLRGRVGQIEVSLAVLEHGEEVRNERRTWRHTACLVDSPLLALTPFFARPQRALDQLGKLLGGEEIAFAEDADFSSAYRLTGPDEPAIRARFDAPSRRWFMERASRRLTCEGSGRSLLLVAPRALAPGEAKELLDTALELAGRWSSTS